MTLDAGVRAQPSLDLRRHAALPAVVLALGLAASASLWMHLDDSRPLAAFADAAGRVAAPVMQLPWLVITAVAVAVAMAAAHYLLAAVALRATSGAALPLAETTLAQLAAAAMNRVAPGGLGAAGVNVRYLSKRGLPTGSAMATVGALGMLGAGADLLAAAVLVFAGRGIGLGGGVSELHMLAAHGMHLFTGSKLAGTAIGAAVLAVVVATAYAVSRQRRRAGDSAGPVERRTARHQLAGLGAQPRRAAATMAASAGTTLALAIGFAAVTSALVGVSAPAPGRLMVAYLVGAAAGGLLPIPAIVGPTEAALTAALVASGVHPGIALTSVLVFRGITFWAPVPVGVFALRTLRRRKAL